MYQVSYLRMFVELLFDWPEKMDYTSPTDDYTVQCNTQGKQNDRQLSLNTQTFSDSSVQFRYFFVVFADKMLHTDDIVNGHELVLRHETMTCASQLHETQLYLIGIF